MRQPYLYPQFDLLERARYMIADNGIQARYTSEQIYAAFDLAAKRMGRFRVPMVFAENESLSDASSYTLPSWMDANIEVQFTTDGELWKDLQGWEVTQDTEGNLQLEFPHVRLTGNVRIVWYAPPPSFPTQPLSTTEVLDTDGTSVATLAPGAFVPARAGWLRIASSERVFYSGVSKDANFLTFTNLVRGLDGTQAQSHEDASEVEVCLPVTHDEQLMYFMALVMEQLHMLFMTDGSPNERDNHAVSVQYWRTMAEELRRRTPSKRTRLRLGRYTLGAWL